MENIQFRIDFDNQNEATLIAMVEVCDTDRPIADIMAILALYTPSWEGMPPVDWQDRYGWVVLPYKYISAIQMAFLAQTQAAILRRIESADDGT
jgi:hypothetical protein